MASAHPDFSISERRAREHDVGADREPDGVIAHDRYLDEHAEDSEDHHNERGNKPKVHSAYLPARLRLSAQNHTRTVTHGNVRHSSQALSELRDTRLIHASECSFELWC